MMLEDYTDSISAHNGKLHSGVSESIMSEHVSYTIVAICDLSGDLSACVHNKRFYEIFQERSIFTLFPEDSHLISRLSMSLRNAPGNCTCSSVKRAFSVPWIIQRATKGGTRSLGISRAIHTAIHIWEDIHLCQIQLFMKYKKSNFQKYIPSECLFPEKVSENIRPRNRNLDCAENYYRRNIII